MDPGSGGREGARARGRLRALRPTAAAPADPLLSHYEDGDFAFQWHMDTFELPSGAELLVAGDGVPNQAYRVDDRAWGVQYHFEIDEPEIRAWLAAFATEADLGSTWGKSDEQVLDEAGRYMAAHERKGRETFRRFAEQARAADR